MTFATPSVTEVWTVAVEGEIDPPAVTALQRRLDFAVDAGGAVVVDLGAVTVMGEPTIGLLCAALRRLSGRGGRLALAGAEPMVKRALERRAIGDVVLHSTTSAAVAAVGHAQAFSQ